MLHSSLRPSWRNDAYENSWVSKFDAEHEYLLTLPSLTWSDFVLPYLILPCFALHHFTLHQTTFSSIILSLGYSIYMTELTDLKKLQYVSSKNPSTTREVSKFDAYPQNSTQLQMGISLCLSICPRPVCCILYSSRPNRSSKYIINRWPNLVWTFSYELIGIDLLNYLS